MYILQSQLDIITELYTIISNYDIIEETNQFAFTMTDGTIGYFSLQELFSTLGTVANSFTIGTTTDPFDIPITVPTTIHEPDFHYYIYDPPRFRGRHLGNTRIVYSTTIPSCGNVEYTLEAVMDYFPYGKTLREFIKTPEKYVTTGHERDVETGLDYRGARFYDGDVARFLSLDPAAMKYPHHSDYCYVVANPLMYIDPDGKNAITTVEEEKDEEGNITGGTITIKSTVYITGKYATQSLVDDSNKLLSQYYKSGEYTDEDGNIWKVNFNIQYALAKADNLNEFNELGVLKGGDNVLLVNEYTIRSGMHSVGSQFGFLRKNASAKVVLHETGHFLGLSDRYTDAHKLSNKKVYVYDGDLDKGKRYPISILGKASIAHKGYETDLMGSPNGTMLHQNHYDNLGRYSLTLYEDSKNTNTNSLIINNAVDFNPKSGLMPNSDVSRLPDGTPYMKKWW